MAVNRAHRAPPSSSAGSMKERSAFTFDPFRLDDVSGMLWRRTTPLPLTPKAFAVLRFLASRAGELVSKDVLLEAVWPDTFVGDGVLKTCVREIRKALADDPKQPQYIETAHRRGYRFVATVHETEAATERVHANAVDHVFAHDRLEKPTASHLSHVALPQGTPTLIPDPSAPPATRPPAAWTPSIPPVRYARSGDVNIAYQVLGDGPLDLVFVMGWVSHIEYLLAGAGLREVSAPAGVVLPFDRLRQAGHGSFRPRDGASHARAADGRCQSHPGGGGLDEGRSARRFRGWADVQPVRRHLPREDRSVGDDRHLCETDLGAGLSVGADTGSARAIHQPDPSGMGRARGHRGPRAEPRPGPGVSRMVGQLPAHGRQSRRRRRLDPHELGDRRARRAADDSRADAGLAPDRRPLPARGRGSVRRVVGPERAVRRAAGRGSPPVRRRPGRPPRRDRGIPDRCRLRPRARSLAGNGAVGEDGADLDSRGRRGRMQASASVSWPT